jgi:hypothetical protein
MGFGAILFASTPVIADAPAPGSQPAAAAPGTPVVVAGPSEYYTPVPTRRGLFARIRERRNATMNYTPAVVPMTTTTPAVAVPAAIPTPMPMNVIPSSGVNTPMGVTTAVYTAPARNGLFSRIRNRRNGTMVPMTTVAPMPVPMAAPMGAVVPASGTTTATTPPVPAAPVMMASTTQTRMGLLARIRARRGN